MTIKLICRKASEKSRTESDISELENDGYTLHTIIPIFSDPTFADMCIILEKSKNYDQTNR